MDTIQTLTSDKSGKLFIDSKKMGFLLPYRLCVSIQNYQWKYLHFACKEKYSKYEDGNKKNGF